MQEDYWLDKWRKRQIGFHEPEINRWLLAHGEFVFSEARRVIVPLCGKSVDLLRLEQRGLEVIGVELALEAITDFFNEAGRVPTETVVDGITAYSSGSITLWHTDWFSLPEKIGRFDAAYDRAALIALPEAMRLEYARVLNALMEPGAKSLLITILYDQQAMAGPPFSASEGELDQLFGDTSRLALGADDDALASNSKFRERGLTALRESAWQLTWPG